MAAAVTDGLFWVKAVIFPGKRSRQNLLLCTYCDRWLYSKATGQLGNVRRETWLTDAQTQLATLSDQHVVWYEPKLLAPLQNILASTLTCAVHFDPQMSAFAAYTEQLVHDDTE